MTARPIPLFADGHPTTAAFTIGRRGFARFQITVVAILAALGLVFTLYTALVGIDFGAMDGFGLADGNAEDPEMAGAAPEGQRLKLAVFGALTLFNLNAEGSFATWWSSFNLAVAAGLCFLVSRRAARASRLHGILWAGLAVVMLLLSMDEVAQVHERLNKAQFILGVLFESLPFRPWVVFGGAFAAIVALAAIPLLLALPRRVAGLIILAGALFVTGAVGLELVAAVLEEGGASLYGLPVMTLILIEETLEMGAIVLFNIVLFNTLVPHGVILRFPDAAAAPTSAAQSRRIEAAE